MQDCTEDCTFFVALTTFTKFLKLNIVGGQKQVTQDLS